MMFGNDSGSNEIPPSVVSALDLIFLLHADHEQNCSTSTCRMIASGGANPFASLAGGVSALWGPLHGHAKDPTMQIPPQQETQTDLLPLRQSFCKLMLSSSVHGQHAIEKLNPVHSPQKGVFR